MKKFILTILGLCAFSAAMAIETPTFPGGESEMTRYIMSNLRYPAEAKENGVEGIVTIGVTVTPEGTLSDLKVIKFVDPDLEKEALRIVGGMPAWIPADKDGVPVAAPTKVDIPFLLE